MLPRQKIRKIRKIGRIPYGPNILQMISGKTKENVGGEGDRVGRAIEEGARKEWKRRGGRAMRPGWMDSQIR